MYLFELLTVIQYSKGLKKLMSGPFDVSEYQIYLYLTISMLLTYPADMIVFGSDSNIRFV